MCLSDFERFVARKVATDDHLQLTNDAQLAEVDSWLKFVNNRGIKSGRTFDADVLSRVYLEEKHAVAYVIQQAIDSATDKSGAIKAITAIRNQIAVKAIQATRLQFENEFEDSLAQAREGQLTRGQWAFRVRALIREFGRQAYRDGLEDGGVDPTELSDDDNAEITRLIQNQNQYVTQLGEAIYKAITDAEATRKPAMWYNRSIAPFYEAGRLSANANGMYEWVIGRTEEHCKTCLAANGQRHRLKSWHRNGVLPQSNGAKELLCKGFNCDCDLVPTSGRASGRLSRIPTG